MTTDSHMRGSTPLPTGTSGADNLMTAPSRILAGVLGLAGTGSGAAAVFWTSNEIGSAALLATGVVALVTAVAGQLPLDVRAGGIGMSFRSGLVTGAELVAAGVEAAASQDDADPVAIARAARSLSAAMSVETGQDNDSRTRATLDRLRRSWKPLSVLTEPTLVDLVTWLSDQRSRENNTSSSEPEQRDTVEVSAADLSDQSHGTTP